MGTFARFGGGSTAHTRLQRQCRVRLAVEALSPGSPLVGQTYFITHHPPTNFVDFYLPFFDALGVQYRVATIPLPLAYGSAIVSETARRLRPPREGDAGTLSRYVVFMLSRDCWFTHARAARDFGCAPILRREEAFEATSPGCASRVFKRRSRCTKQAPTFAADLLSDSFLGQIEADAVHERDDILM